MSWLDDLLGKRIMRDNDILPDRKILRFIQANNATVSAADNTTLGSTDITFGFGSQGSGTYVVNTLLTPAMNGARISNIGAGGVVTFTLPATADVAVGQVFYFRQMAAHAIKVLANSGQTIQMDSLVSSTAGYVQSLDDGIGSAIVIEAVSTTKWFASSIQRAWDIA